MKIAISFVEISLILVLFSVLTSSTSTQRGPKQYTNRGIQTHPNDYLIQKWIYWYESLDVNQDGTISMEDADDSVNKFLEVHSFEPVMKRIMMGEFQYWWNLYVFRGRTGNISKEDFVDDLKLLANKAKFIREMKYCFKTIFYLTDANQDRSISRDEYIANVALGIIPFEVYNPIDDRVPLEDFDMLWVEFVTSTDDSQQGILKVAFDTALN